MLRSSAFDWVTPNFSTGNEKRVVLLVATTLLNEARHQIVDRFNCPSEERGGVGLKNPWHPSPKVIHV